VRPVATVLIVLVAALHIYFLVLEMFLWRTPFGRRTFGTTAEVAETSAVLAANQGLYNGFLAAGLVWALLWYGTVGGRAILTFFLVCVVAAGIFGGVTVSRRILLVQALPATIAAALLWLS
jgi:putative membrane protein